MVTKATREKSIAFAKWWTSNIAIAKNDGRMINYWGEFFIETRTSDRNRIRQYPEITDQNIFFSKALIDAEFESAKKYGPPHVHFYNPFPPIVESMFLEAHGKKCGCNACIKWTKEIESYIDRQNNR